MESNATPPAGEQPQAPAEQVTPAGEKPQERDFASLLDDAPLEDLRAALDHQEAPSQPEPEQPKPEPEPEPEQPGEQPEPESTTPEPEATPKPEASAPSRLRIATLPENDQVVLAKAVEAVKKGDFPDIAAAVASLTGKPAPASEAAPTPDAPPVEEPQPEAPKTSADLTNELEDLYAQQDQARADYDREAEAKLERQIYQKREQIRDAKDAEREAAISARAQAASYETTFQSEVAAVETRYEAARDDDSAFSRILADRITAARARGDESLADPRFISRFADEVAADLGIKPAGKEPTPIPPKPAPQPAPVGGGVAPGHKGGSRPTSAEALKAFDAMSPEEQAAVLDSL